MIINVIIVIPSRLKSEVLDQLPDKQRSVVLLDPTLLQKQDRQAEYLSQRVNDDQLRYFHFQRIYINIYLLLFEYIVFDFQEGFFFL